MKDLNVQSPQQTWNCDENGCQDVPKECHVVGETGIEACTIVGKEQGETLKHTGFLFGNFSVCLI